MLSIFMFQSTLGILERALPYLFRKICIHLCLYNCKSPFMNICLLFLYFVFFFMLCLVCIIMRVMGKLLGYPYESITRPLGRSRGLNGLSLVAKIDRDSYESELVYIPIFSSFLVSFFA